MLLNMQLTLREKTWHTDDIYSLKFEKPKDFDFKPGQFLNLTINVNDKPEKRAYSISSSPTESFIMFTIKREDYPEEQEKRAKSVSTGLSKLEPGDIINARGPFGIFILEENSNLVFIAGGTGVTPFRCMSKYILDNNIKANITLFYSARAEKDFLFYEEFNKLNNENIKFIPTATRDENFKGNKGRIDKNLLKNNIKNFTENTYYICVPKLFVEAVENILLKSNVDKKKIKVDKWG